MTADSFTVCPAEPLMPSPSNEYAKRVADKAKEYKERDARMKYGKSYKKYTSDAEKSKTRLRPGEVKRYDKEKGKWVSNKD